MPKILVKTKEGVGKFVRLTDPGFSYTIDSSEAVEVDEQVYNRMRRHLDKAPPKPKVIKTVKREIKLDSDSKE
jgi:hypothetical protein